MPRCPKDPKLNYSIKFCKEMVKKGIRPWCKNCVHVNKKVKREKK